MNIFLGAFFLVCAVNIVYCMYKIRRVNRVYELRKWMIDCLYECANDDIRNNRDPRWRWRVFDKVSFQDMIKSWKPVELENFWDDDDFICYTEVENV